MLPFTDSYIRAALLARKNDAQIQKQLTVMTTSAGFPGAYIKMIKDAGMIHQHKVGSTRQAVKAEEAGVDVVIAAGFEMGGHTSGKAIHTFVLVPNMTEAVSIPVLLTGGARDGRGLAAALVMGASGVAMGTRFILSEENTDWHPKYLQALLDAKEGDDVAFNGVDGPCRGLRNATSTEFLEATGRGGSPEAQMRKKLESMQRAQSEGDVENGIVMTGQVASGISSLIKIAELVPGMAEDALRILPSADGQPIPREVAQEGT